MAYPISQAGSLALPLSRYLRLSNIPPKASFSASSSSFSSLASSSPYPLNPNPYPAVSFFYVTVWGIFYPHIFAYWYRQNEWDRKPQGCNNFTQGWNSMCTTLRLWQTPTQPQIKLKSFFFLPHIHCIIIQNALKNVKKEKEIIVPVSPFKKILCRKKTQTTIVLYCLYYVFSFLF